MVAVAKPIEPRLMVRRRIDEKGCWLFSGFINQNGYGRISVNGKPETVSRVAYELFVGPIPDGLGVLHKCDVRHCFNPAHLFVGTAKDNLQDAANKDRCKNQFQALTHCKHGHPFSGANLLVLRRGYRVCRTCNRERQRAHAISERKAEALL